MAPALRISAANGDSRASASNDVQTGFVRGIINFERLQPGLYACCRTRVVVVSVGALVRIGKGYVIEGVHPYRKKIGAAAFPRHIVARALHNEMNIPLLCEFEGDGDVACFRRVNGVYEVISQRTWRLARGKWVARVILRQR